MGVTVGTRGDVVVAALAGPLTVGTREALKRGVLDALAGGGRRVVLDFADAGYVDSTGLGLLVHLAKRARERGGEVRLANVSDDVRTLLRLTRLDTLFEVGELGAGERGAAEGERGEGEGGGCGEVPGAAGARAP